MTDREKLIELLRDFFKSLFLSFVYDSLADHLIANGVVVREKGEWLTDEEDAYWGNSIKRKYCSVCGKRPHFDRETGKYILTDFCHSCGADMRC